MRAVLRRLRAVAATVAATEPARLAEAVRTVLAALVGLGWLTLDDTGLTTIATVVGFGLSWLLTNLVRRKVVPVTTLPSSDSQGD